MDDECEFCGNNSLKLVEADPPWSIEHFICTVCDSTFNVELEIVLEPDFKL